MNQLARRNLAPFQKIRLVEKRRDIIAARGTKAQQELNKPLSDRQIGAYTTSGISDSYERTTDEQLGKVAGVGHETVRRARIIEKEASQEIKEQLLKGEGIRQCKARGF